MHAEIGAAECEVVFVPFMLEHMCFALFHPAGLTYCVWVGGFGAGDYCVGKHWVCVLRVAAVKGVSSWLWCLCCQGCIGLGLFAERWEDDDVSGFSSARCAKWHWWAVIHVWWHGL